MLGKLNYAKEKLSAARRMLMLPHPKGEEQSLANAFNECHLGFHGLTENDFDERARDWFRVINGALDKASQLPSDPRGTHYMQATRMDEAERWAFSNAVDEICYWLDRS